MKNFFERIEYKSQNIEVMDILLTCFNIAFFIVVLLGKILNVELQNFIDLVVLITLFLQLYLYKYWLKHGLMKVRM